MANERLNELYVRYELLKQDIHTLRASGLLPEKLTREERISVAYGLSEDPLVTCEMVANAIDEYDARSA